MGSVLILLCLLHLGTCADDVQSTAKPGLTTPTSTPASVPLAETEIKSAPSSSTSDQGDSVPASDVSDGAKPALAVAETISFGFIKPGESQKVIPENLPDPPPRNIRKISPSEVVHYKAKLEQGPYAPLIEYANAGTGEKSNLKYAKVAGGKGGRGDRSRIKLSPQSESSQSRPSTENRQMERTGESQIPIGSAVDELKGKGYRVDAANNEPNTVMITPPKNEDTGKDNLASTITPTTKRPAVDPPTISMDSKQDFSADLSPFLTSSPKMLPVEGTEVEPQCPSISQFIASSAQLWNGITQADGVKAGFGVLYNAAASAISTLTQCAKRLLESLGNLLFSKESGESKVAQNETSGPNIRTRAGRHKYGHGPYHSRATKGNDTLIIFEDEEVKEGTTVENAMPLEERLKDKVKRLTISAPASGKSEDGLVDEVEDDELVEETGKQMDNVDPVLYQ